MRLLLTTDTVGGVWTFTCELAAQLLQRGHAIALVSFGRQPSPDQEAWTAAQVQAFGDRFQFTPTEIPLEWMDRNTHAFDEGDAVLRSVAADCSPDVLVSNQFCFGATSLDLPRIVVAHSDVLSWASACKPEAQTPSPWLNRYTALVQRGLMQADTVIAPTRWMLKALSVNFFLPAGGSVVPNGRALPTPTSHVQKRLQAITAGRLWDEAKGLDELLRTQLPLPVLIVGETGTATVSDPESDTSNLRFLGRLPSEQLQAAFQESAIYLCTSRYEPFGLAPLEAALCGCAVLSRDLPSLREIWGEDALYFQDGPSLQAQTERLCEDPAALAAAQQRSWQRAARFTPERMADAYLAILESVRAQRGATPHVA